MFPDFLPPIVTQNFFSKSIFLVTCTRGQLLQTYTNVNQDQNVLNMHSDLGSTLSDKKIFLSEKKFEIALCGFLTY